MTPSKNQSNKSGPCPNSDEGWEKLSSHKRSTAQREKTNSLSQPMTTEVNHAKIEKIQTQIAILQCELALETQMAEDQYRIR